MTVKQLSEIEGFKVITMPDGNREICGAYIGDLLSWVMGRAQENNIWVTIMSNINTVAVASLADVSCILLAENVALENEVAKTAAEKGINVLSTGLGAYEAALKLGTLI